MRLKIHLITFFVCILFLSFVFNKSVLAADFRVTGTTFDNKNDPVAHTTITVMDDTTQKIITTTTSDQNGYYSLFVPKGTYDININPPFGSNLKPTMNSHILITSDISLHDDLNPIVNVTNVQQNTQQASIKKWIGWLLLSLLVLVIITAVGFALVKNKKQK